MDRLRSKFRKLRRIDAAEDGQGLAEYALILALVALACLAALGALGEAISTSPGFTDLPGALTGS